MKLSQALAALRERIRQRVEGEVNDLPDFRPPSLEELEKRRQDAANWAEAVGRVNPRRGRLYDAPLQGLKRLMVRGLRWYTHPQRQFNAAQSSTLAEIQQLLADHNRNLAVIAQAVVQAQQTALEALEQVQALRAAVPGDLEQRLQSAGARIEAAREGLEQQIGEQRRSLDGRLVANLAEVRAKVDSLEFHLKENVKALSASLNDVQQKFWAAQQDHRTDLEQQLRLVRQRLRAPGLLPAATTPPEAGEPPAAPPVPAMPQAAQPPSLDYFHFQDRFRGTEAEVRERQAVYLPLFKDRSPVLDVACGRGEFLAVLREAGIEARGVDLDSDMVARCREQDLAVECGDAFACLEQLPDESLGGVFSAQFIEHLPPNACVRLIQLAFSKLKHGGVLLLETQNPECLITLSQTFYLDPTHVAPIPAPLMRFWMKEAGFGQLSTYLVSPIDPTLPALPLFEETTDNALITHWNIEAKRFNETYFGCQDYAVAGFKKH